MKIQNRLLSFILAGTMVLGLSACGSSGNDAADSKSTGGENANVTNTSGKETGETAGASEVDPILKDGEMSELLIVFPGSNSAPADREAVESAINDMIADTVDATVKLQPLEWGVYDDQINLMLSSGEKMDLYFSYSGTKDYANRGQVTDITELVDTYASGAKAVMEKFIPACYVDGKLYGMPSFRDMAIQSGFICRTDILEETGIAADSIKTWDDVEKVLQKVQELYPDMAPLVGPEPRRGPFEYYLADVFDIIQSGVGVYVSDSDGTVEVINTYNTPEYLETAKKAYEWNEKGYFIADSTTRSDTRQDYFKAGSGFGYIGRCHPGTATNETLNAGMDMTVIPITDVMTGTDTVNFVQWTVPTACKTPEKAVAFMNILYTNADVQNLFLYGLEGTDYEIKDAAKDIAGYPDGVDSASVGWTNQSWITGNASIAHQWETDPEGVWDAYTEWNNSAKTSQLYGFIYDNSNVANEITAIQNVCDKYEAIIEAGLTDPEETVEKFNQELEQAGIQVIIDDVQQQADAWLAAN